MTSLNSQTCLFEDFGRRQRDAADIPYRRLAQDKSSANTLEKLINQEE